GAWALQPARQTRQRAPTRRTDSRDRNILTTVFPCQDFADSRRRLYYATRRVGGAPAPPTLTSSARHSGLIAGRKSFMTHGCWAAGSRHGRRGRRPASGTGYGTTAWKPPSTSTCGSGTTRP